MKLEREVIIDLLPAYFSGEASTATRTLVEDFFRENPDFEKSARSAAGPLESLKAAPSRLGAGLDPEKEKLALERARLVTETRTSFFWLAVISTLMLFLFRIQNGKLIWIVWGGSVPVSGAGGHYSSQWRYSSGSSIFMPAAVLLRCLPIQSSCGWQLFIAFSPACSKSKTIESSGCSFRVIPAREFLSSRLPPLFGASTLSSAGSSSGRNEFAGL